MNYKLIWILLLILQALVTSMPIQGPYDVSVVGVDQKSGTTSPDTSKYGDTSDSGDEQVISVRITSSVAVGRGKEKLLYRPQNHNHEQELKQPTSVDTLADERSTGLNAKSLNSPPIPLGANIEYIKQLNTKKEARDHIATVNPFHMAHGQYPNEHESTNPERIGPYIENIQDIPIARKIPSTSNVNRFHEQNQNRGYQNNNMNNAPPEIFEYGSQINLRKKSHIDPSENFNLRNDVNHKNVENKTNSQITVQQIKNQDINSFSPQNNNYQPEDSVAESSIKAVEFAKSSGAAPPSTNYIHNLSDRHNENQNNPALTTVSFNIVHDAASLANANERSNSYISSSHIISNQQDFYAPPKIYSKPSQIYSEPSKFYSEPAKIYSEPSKIYSEPAKIYSEPSKIYSEPAKYYSEPASLHLDENVPHILPSIPPNFSNWQGPAPSQIGSNTINTTPIAAISNTYQGTQTENQPATNYGTNDKGVQDSTTEKCKEDSCKVGYVVEGRQYKKYRVEERTSDGFIVGEYGVVRNEDGALRGVRYTADSDASPRLIHDALMKFLQL